MNRVDAILLCGPTASGKSELALALARRAPVEIVSVDSAQVYRGFDIGAAKPDAATRAAIPHHLIDLRDPQETYSAGEFVADALRAIADIRARGRMPLLVGGTMLYFNALLRGLAPLPRADAALRSRLDARAAAEGWPALHAELAAVDPAAAARIHPNDPQRIQRALEVWLTRRPDSLPAAPAAEKPASLRAVGYRQLWACLDAPDPGAGLALAVDKAIAATRQLAKRQLTWINADPGWSRLDPSVPVAKDRWLDAMQVLCDRGGEGTSGMVNLSLQ
ncbi:MAG: tRNA (adenosine(37)-N6)-dimethylallyltransferase MiaA [Gammaproteobacteria bacterium]|nr:tRNA (adenosine(37)-N6)-dimethylallyltransferase MiaA [Gammaproteobacteria bacterium]